jgi:hypothetical protein
MNNTLKNVLIDKKKTNKKKERDIQKYKNYFKSINHENKKLDALKDSTKINNITTQLMNEFVNEKECINKNIDPELVALNNEHIKNTNYGLDCDINIPDILNGFVNEKEFINKNIDPEVVALNKEHIKNTNYGLDCDINIPRILNGFVNEKECINKNIDPEVVALNKEHIKNTNYGLDCDINIPDIFNGFVNEKECISKNIDPEVVSLNNENLKNTKFNIDFDINIPNLLNGLEKEYNSEKYAYEIAINEEKSKNYYGLDCEINIPKILNGFVNENDYTNKNYDVDLAINNENLKNTKFNIDIDVNIPNLLNGLENDHIKNIDPEVLANVNEYIKKTNYGLDCDINVPELLNKFVNENEYNNKFDTEHDIYDINDVYSRNIKTIYNIYQESYKHNVKSTGFGDFIRGCYFILNFCDTFKLQCKIIINHSIKKFLKNGIQLPVSVSLRNIKLFVNNNCADHSTDSNGFIHNITGNKINSAIISYLSNDVPVINESVFIYNIVYPSHVIDKKHKIHMRHLLEPIDQMNNKLQYTLRNLNLTKGRFCVIHFRCGDKYLKDLALKFDNDDYIKRLTKEIFMLIKSNKLNFPISSYLLIADNIEIKRIITKQFPSIKVQINEITHFGEGFIQEDIKVQNTLLDFYLMSYSSHIFSFSSYKHGSGFSQWCAETYDIPYTCKLIQ